MRAPGKGLGLKNTSMVSALAHIGIALTHVVVDASPMAALPNHAASDSFGIANVAADSNAAANSASANYVAAAT